MRIITLALRSVLAVVLAVALALPTGLAAAQDLTDAAQQSDDTAEQSDGTQSDDTTATDDTQSNGTDEWAAGDATAFTDFSDKEITRTNAKTGQNVYLMVDSQFVSKKNGTWTEGVGPNSDGKAPDDVYKGTYTGSDQVVPDRQDAVTSDGFLSSSKDDSTKLHYYWDSVGTTDAGGMWSDLQTNLKGDSFEGLYVYYKSQLRTRLAWAGNITEQYTDTDGMVKTKTNTWVVPWDSSKEKAGQPQCNPSDKNSDKNKCFMTKLADGAYLAMSFFTAGSKVINYGSAVSAGNAIGLASDTGTDDKGNPKAQNDAGTILNRSHKDNQPTILRYDEKVRPGYDFTFNVQLSHGGTYLRVFFTESREDASVSACPVASDVNDKNNQAFLGKDTTNRVYSEAIPGGGDSYQNDSEVTVTTNASDSKVKTVTIKGAKTGSTTSNYLGVCVQEVYWYTTTNNANSNQQQTVKLSSTFAMLNDQDITSQWVRGGMYIKTFSDTRASSGTAGGTNYYPKSNVGPNATTDFTFNSCSSSARTTYPHWKNAYGRGYCDDNYLWVTGTNSSGGKAGYEDGIPRDGNLDDSGGVYGGGRMVNPGTAFFEQLRRGNNDYGDDIVTGTNVRRVKGQASRADADADVAMSSRHDEDTNTLSRNVEDWRENKDRTASVEKDTKRGDTVSFLVMNTSRVSDGQENTNNPYGYTQLPSSLSICATTTTTTTTTNCENVSVSELESVASPYSSSRNNNAWNAGLDGDLANGERRRQGQEEVDFYKTTNHSNTVVLKRGALKGTRVTLTFLPQFFRDGHVGFGGFWTKNGDVRAIHPLLVTVENVTANMEMHLNWTKNSQKFLNMGDVSGLADLQIAKCKYISSSNKYHHEMFHWEEFSASRLSSQWHDYTDVLDEGRALVIKFKIATGYRIGELIYGSPDDSQDKWESVKLSNVSGEFKSDPQYFPKYDGETDYYRYTGGTKLNDNTKCLQGDTDGWYYCRIKGSGTYQFSFRDVTVSAYEVNYDVANADDGVKKEEVDTSSYEEKPKNYNAAEFAGSDGLRVTVSRPVINAPSDGSPSKFFMYWKVYITRKNGDPVAVKGTAGDSVDSDGTLVVYPGQRVAVSKYYAQMPADTDGVKLQARWTTATEYEAVTRQVTAWVQTYNSGASSPYGWSATVGSGTSAVTLRQESYVVLVPENDASSGSSYASTYPAYEGTTKQDGKGFLPTSATLQSVSNGTGGWTTQSTNYTLVSDNKDWTRETVACSALATGTGVDDYCKRNDIKSKMGAGAANPGASVASGKYGDGQMMVGYYRVELSSDQKVSYRNNVCAANDTAKTDCGYDYDTSSNDIFTASVDDSSLFRGRYLFDNTRVPTAGSANMELPWRRLKAGSTSETAFQWLFKHWSLDKTRDATSRNTFMTGMVIGLTQDLNKNVLGAGDVYYAQWENNSTPAFSIRTEKSDGSDLENGAVFQLFMWDFDSATGKDPTSEDLIERNADGTGKAGATKNGFWLPVIQEQDDYVLIPTAAQVTAGTAKPATQVTTGELMSHSGVAQWRGLSNGYSETGGNVTLQDYQNSSDAAKQQAYADSVDGKITLPTTLNFKGKIFALIQVKAPSSKYICNTGQWMFQISDYVSGVDSTISSQVFKGTSGVNSNSIYTWGAVGGTDISTAGTVHAIKESVPNRTGKDAYKRVAAVVNIDAFDLPAAGWRLSLALLAAGLALTVFAWVAYALSHRRRAQHVASA